MCEYYTHKDVTSCDFKLIVVCASCECYDLFELMQF